MKSRTLTKNSHVWSGVGAGQERGDSLFLHFEDRLSDWPWIERVWRSHSERAGLFHSIASCQWEMVVTRCQGKTFLTVRGPETKVTAGNCPAEGEWVAIRFKLGTFMPLLRPGVLRDRND